MNRWRQHENPSLGVDHHRRGEGAQPHHVMLPAVTVWLLDVDQPEADPRVDVDGTLTVDLPPHELGSSREGVGLRLRDRDGSQRRMPEACRDT
jgi:hypothetical protein